MAERSGAPSARTRVKRVHENAAYDRETIDEILDAALFCHLGFEREGQPYVIPTLHARLGDRLYFHGSSASRTVRAVSEGIPACVTVTLLDGIVFARSVFEHAINYRSGRRARNRRRPSTEKLLPGTGRTPGLRRAGTAGHREAAPRPLRGLAPPDAQGAEGDRRALASPGRGLRQGPHGRARRRRDTGCRARHLGRPYSPEREVARSGARTRPQAQAAVPGYAKRYRRPGLTD